MTGFILLIVFLLILGGVAWRNQSVLSIYLAGIVLIFALTVFFWKLSLIFLCIVSAVFLAREVVTGRIPALEALSRILAVSLLLLVGTWAIQDIGHFIFYGENSVLFESIRCIFNELHVPSPDFRLPGFERSEAWLGSLGVAFLVSGIIVDSRLLAAICVFVGIILVLTTGIPFLFGWLDQCGVRYSGHPFRPVLKFVMVAVCICGIIKLCKRSLR